MLWSLSAEWWCDVIPTGPTRRLVFRCPICGKIVDTEETTLRPGMPVEEVIDYRCPQCVAAFQRPAASLFDSLKPKKRPPEFNPVNRVFGKSPAPDVGRD